MNGRTALEPSAQKQEGGEGEKWGCHSRTYIPSPARYIKLANFLISDRRGMASRRAFVLIPALFFYSATGLIRKFIFTSKKHFFPYNCGLLRVLHRSACEQGTLIRY